MQKLVTGDICCVFVVLGIRQSWHFPPTRRFKGMKLRVLLVWGSQGGSCLWQQPAGCPFPLASMYWRVVDGGWGSSIDGNYMFASLCRRFADGSSRTAYIHHYDLAIAAAELQPAQIGSCLPNRLLPESVYWRMVFCLLNLYLSYFYVGLNFWNVKI